MPSCVVDEMKRNPFDPKEKTTCFSFLPPGEGIKKDMSLYPCLFLYNIRQNVILCLSNFYKKIVTQ